MRVNVRLERRPGGGGMGLVASREGAIFLHGFYRSCEAKGEGYDDAANFTPRPLAQPDPFSERVCPLSQLPRGVSESIDAPGRS